MTEDLKLNMDAFLPLRDVVFNTLREAILKGDLKPGERLMELQLEGGKKMTAADFLNGRKITLGDILA